MGLADIVSVGTAGGWGEQGATAPSAVNPGPVNGQPGTKSFWGHCYCDGGNGLPGASATVPGGTGGNGGWGGRAFNLNLTIDQIEATGNTVTLVGVGGTGGTGGTGGNGGSGAPGGNAGGNPASCQLSPCALTVGGTGGNGTAAGNGGSGGTGGTGPTITMYYTAANKTNLEQNIAISAQPGNGGGGGGGGGAGGGGSGGNNEIVQDQPMTYAANGQPGPNTATAGGGGSNGNGGLVNWQLLS